MKKFLSILLMVGLFAIATTAQMSPNDPIPVDPAVRIGILENGIKYYIRFNEKPEDRAELRLAVHAGSNQEDENQQGLAHFVEHMAFNGTKNFEKSELVDFLESIGTRFGPDLNAYTSFDETVYMLQARTDTMALLEKGLLILEDWASGVVFEDEEIDKERGVVESEWRTGLGPDKRMLDKWLPVVYEGSRYAERLPIGDPEIINNADYETVKKFYKDWYRPDLMAVIAIGDFDLDWMEQEIKTRFNKIKPIENPRARQTYSVPMHEETRIAILTDPEASFTQVQLDYKHERKKTKSLMDLRRDLTYNLYNRMLSARLEELTQEAEPPFTFGYSGYGSSFVNVDEYSCFAFASEGQSMKALKALLVENKRVLKHGFTASELERAKIEVLKRLERGVKEKDKTESRRFAMQLVSNFLDENPIPSVEQRFELYQALVPSIQLGEINQLPKKWITKENRSIVITGPEKEGLEVPTNKEVLELIAAVDAMAVDPYEDEVSDEPLLAAELEAVRVVEETLHDEAGVTEYVFENGVKVILKPTDFKNDEISMRSYSPGGLSLYPDEDYWSGSSISRVLSEAGVGNFTNVQLQKMLTGKKVSVSPYIGELYEGMNGNCSPDDFETLLQLVYLNFTAPRKDETALQSYVNKQKSFFSNIMANPNYYFYGKSAEIRYDGNIRRKFVPAVEDMDAISLDRGFEIYQERFEDASDFTFFFVGNFDTATIKPMLAKYLGNLPATNRKETWKDLGIKAREGVVNEKFFKGEAPKSQIEIFWHDAYKESTDKERLTFDYMMRVMRIKLREAMREDEGGVYGVRVSGSPSKYPTPKYTITISFNSDPENVDNLIGVAKQEIDKVRKNPPAEKDMQKVRETLIQGRIKDLKENRWWMNKLNSIYRDGDEDLKGFDLEQYKQLVNSITAEDVQRAASKYFNDSNVIQMIMMPGEPVEN